MQGLATIVGPGTGLLLASGLVGLAELFWPDVPDWARYVPIGLGWVVGVGAVTSGVIGAVRLALPDSVYTREFYGPEKRRLTLSRYPKSRSNE